MVYILARFVYVFLRFYRLFLWMVLLGSFLISLFISLLSSINPCHPSPPPPLRFLAFHTMNACDD